MFRRTLVAFAALLACATQASAHIVAGTTASFAAGFPHPLSGLDHMPVMVAVGLWAALKGGAPSGRGRAAFVGVMLVGGALGMAHVPVPSWSRASSPPSWRSA